MKILITGVAGLLGSRLADWICENTDHEVIGIDDLSGGYIENVHPDVDFIKMDLVNLYEVERVFTKYKFDIVYHFAAYAAEGLSPFIRKFNSNYVYSSINRFSYINVFRARCCIDTSLCVFNFNLYLFKRCCKFTLNFDTYDNLII